MQPRFNEQVQRWSMPMVQIGRCIEAQSLARSVVQVVGDVIALGLRDRAHASAFKTVLPKQAGVRPKTWTGYAAIPKLLRCSVGLRKPSEILIRASLYQRM